MTREDINKFKDKIRREILSDLLKVMEQKLTAGSDIESIKISENAIVFKREDMKILGRNNAITILESKVGLALGDLLQKYRTGNFLIEIYRTED